MAAREPLHLNQTQQIFQSLILDLSLSKALRNKLILLAKLLFYYNSLINGKTHKTGLFKTSIVSGNS